MLVFHCYLKLSDLKQQKYVTLQVHNLEAQHGPHWAKTNLSANSPSGGSGRESVSLPSPTAREALIPRLVASFCHLKTRVVTTPWAYFHCPCCLWLFCVCLPLLSTLVIILVHLDTRLLFLFYSQLFSKLSSIYHLYFPFPCNLTYSQVLGIKMWTSLGRSIILPTTGA